MNEFDQHPARDITRRHFFSNCQAGLGSIALASLMGNDAPVAIEIDSRQPLLPRQSHFPDCYTMFMAGGGVKPGFVYGQSDELGFSVAENPVHVHDLQATIMHLLGFDHERLTHFYQGRNFRLTDVHGSVVHEVLA